VHAVQNIIFKQSIQSCPVAFLKVIWSWDRRTDGVISEMQPATERVALTTPQLSKSSICPKPVQATVL